MLRVLPLDGILESHDDASLGFEVIVPGAGAEEISDQRIDISLGLPELASPDHVEVFGAPAFVGLGGVASQALLLVELLATELAFEDSLSLGEGSQLTPFS